MTDFRLFLFEWLFVAQLLHLILKRRNRREVKKMNRFLKDQSGQDLVEYALLLVFLALAAIGILPVLSGAINNVFSTSASYLGNGS